MKVSKYFLGAGLLLCAVGILLSICGVMVSTPALLAEPKEAMDQVEMLMDAVCSGSYGYAQTLLYGEPDLGMDKAPETEVGQVIREWYQDSLSYSFSREFSATDTGLTTSVQVSSMDLAALLVTLGNSGDLATEQQWISELELRKDTGLPRMERSITVNLIYEGGRWWILPETPILGIISGIPE